MRQLFLLLCCILTVGSVMADINQDGRDDLVQVQCESNVFTVALLLPNGNVYSNFSLTGSVTNHTAQDRWSTGDFDGNGTVDLLRLWGGTDGLTYCEVEKTLQDGTLNLVSWANGLGSFSASQRWFSGDFDGDGMDDLVVMPYNTTTTTLTLNVYRSSGTNFTQSSWYNSSSSRAQSDWFFLGDFNGDGADDITRVYSNGVNAACQVLTVNAGKTGFDKAAWISSGYVYLPDARWYPGDYNADGRMDFAVVRSTNGVAKADVLLSTGSGFTVHLNWINGSDAYTYGDQIWYPGDFDGDGNSDLIKMYNQEGSLSADVYRSTGSGFSRAEWISQDGSFQDTADYFLTDFNGDGKDDISVVKRVNNQSVADVYQSSGTGFMRIAETVSQQRRIKSLRGAPAIRAHKYFDPHCIIGPIPADGGDYASVCKSGQDVYLTSGAVYERDDGANSALAAYAHQQVIETFEAKTLNDFAWIIRTGVIQKGLVSIAGYSSVLVQNMFGDGRYHFVTPEDVDAGFVRGGTHFQGGKSGSNQRFNRVYSFDSVAQSVFKIQEAGGSSKNVFSGNRVQNCMVFGAGVDARGNGRNPNFKGTWADAIGMCHRDTVISNNVVIDGTDVGIVLFTAPYSKIQGNAISAVSRAALGGINLLDTLYYTEWGIGGVDPEGRTQFNFSSLVVSNYLDARGARMDIGIPVGDRTWSPEPPISTNNPYGCQIFNNTLDGKAFGYGIAVANAFNVTATGNVSYATHSGVGGFFADPNRRPDPASAFAYSTNHVFNSTYGAEFSPATKPHGLDFLIFNTKSGRVTNELGYIIIFYEPAEAEATVEMAFLEMLRRYPTTNELASYKNRLLTNSALLGDDIRLELMNSPAFSVLYPDYTGGKTLNDMQIHRETIWLENLKMLDEQCYDTAGNYPDAKALYQDALSALVADEVTVPNVVGLTQAAAITSLTNAGLLVGTITSNFSSTVASGNVLSQSPTSGVSAGVGSSVDLVISIYVQMVTVPNVVGLTQAAAITSITNAGLVAGTVTSTNSETVAAGHVISQNPTNGVSVAAGDSVHLLVSTGYPAQTTTTWSPGSGSSDWTAGASWTGGVAPIRQTQNLKVTFKVEGAQECVLNTNAIVAQMVVGDNGTTNGNYLRLIRGADLLCGRNASGVTIWTAIGYTRPATVTVESGAVFRTAGNLLLGFQGVGSSTLMVNGGTATISTTIDLGHTNNTAFGLITVDSGGRLTATGLNFKNTNSVVEIRNGSVLLTGNQTASVSNSIAAGRIITDGSSGALRVDYNLSNPGFTTVRTVGYGTWAASFGVDLGAPTNDYDGDSRNNLYEYALNGNPTNRLSEGIEPSLMWVGDQLHYVYLRRNDDTNIVYSVQATTNLVSGVWTTDGINAVTNVTGAVYDEVTHRVSTTNQNLYLRLRIMNE